MTADEHPVISPKKLIEVALPLDAINEAATKEKGNPFLKGHPRNIHQWWARRPLAVARAVIFSQLVNDPEDLWWHQNPGAVPNKQVRGHWTKSRKRLFEIIEELVLWENTTNEEKLERAREEIRKSWREVCELNKSHPQAAELFNPDKMPGLHDPFAGGGAIPLEAQRLGLEAYASDLNPVAVLINKAMIEIPTKFAGRPPVHPDARKDKKLFAKEWTGAEGLAEDVRRYGKWMRDKAHAQLGHLYPPVVINKEVAKNRPDLKDLVGESIAPSAWLWARTVLSPNPAFSDVAVPLIRTFVLSKKNGHQAYLEPVINGRDYTFKVQVGEPPSTAQRGTTAGKRAGFECLMSRIPISYEYIRTEGQAGRIGYRLIAIVADTPRGKAYLPALGEHETAASVPPPTSRPMQPLCGKAGMNVPLYGIRTFADLFTQRQLVALTGLSALVHAVRAQVLADATRVDWQDDKRELNGGGNGPTAYADAVATLMAMAIDKSADYTNAICSWNNVNQNIGHLFTKQAIPMAWDFAEMDPINGGLSIDAICEGISRSISMLPSKGSGVAFQADCATNSSVRENAVISTDPPYYDNISYADLSDFFYVWLRQSLRDLFPDLFSSIATPKSEELIANPFRHQSAAAAEAFFLTGMTKAMGILAKKAHAACPITIYYAFKQSETADDAGTSSPGWETFLQAVHDSGLSITGTWPVRTERAERSLGQGRNTLASSIVLVCRPRATAAATLSRRQFVRLLDEALPDALAKMTGAEEGNHSPVAPVDLSQAIIGPGMAIFSRYDAVLEADGTPMTVKTALQLINRFLAEDDFDGDTQFCLHWFEQHGWEKAKFGEADTLARAKGTSVEGVKAAGVIESGGSNVRLLKWKEYAADWNPSLDTRLPVWEALHHLIRAYSSKGDAGAGKVLKACAGKAEAARQLAYRLYTLCERKSWAEDARAYNEIVTGWTGIEKSAGTGGEEQRELFDG